MAVVRAKQTMWVSSQRIVHAGDLFDSTDPVVKGREALFESAVQVVEQATAAPGEKRSRAKKSS
jgi:hypothetical protein